MDNLFNNTFFETSLLIVSLIRPSSFNATENTTERGVRRFERRRPGPFNTDFARSTDVFHCRIWMSKLTYGYR